MSRVCPNTLQACECDIYAMCASTTGKPSGRAMTSPSRARPSDRVSELVEAAAAVLLANTSSADSTHVEPAIAARLHAAIAAMPKAPEARAGDCATVEIPYLEAQGLYSFLSEMWQALGSNKTPDTHARDLYDWREKIHAAIRRLTTKATP